MRGGGRKFNQSLLMVHVLEGEQLCSQNLLFNPGVFRQQEARPPPPLVVLWLGGRGASTTGQLDSRSQIATTFSPLYRGFRWPRSMTSLWKSQHTKVPWGCQCDVNDKTLTMISKYKMLKSFDTIVQIQSLTSHFISFFKLISRARYVHPGPE